MRKTFLNLSTEGDDSMKCFGVFLLLLTVFQLAVLLCSDEESTADLISA